MIIRILMIPYHQNTKLLAYDDNTIWFSCTTSLKNKFGWYIVFEWETNCNLQNFTKYLDGQGFLEINCNLIYTKYLSGQRCWLKCVYILMSSNSLWLWCWPLVYVKWLKSHHCNMSDSKFKKVPMVGILICFLNIL